jgi:hypothetical protein
MNYLSIDIETGGLELEHSILEVGLVHAPSMDVARIVVMPQKGIRIDPYCCWLHKYLLEEIKTVQESEWWREMALEFAFARVPADQPEATSPYLTWYVREGWEEKALIDALDYLHVPWCTESINIAGKNVVLFDLPRLEYRGWFGTAKESNMVDGLPFFPEISGPPRAPFRWNKRVLDPAILFYRPGDACLPDFKTCCERANVVPGGHHNAVKDAIDVCRLLKVGIGI